MNGCNGEGNLLTCNKYCPELGVAGYDNTGTEVLVLQCCFPVQSFSVIPSAAAAVFLASDNSE